MSEGAGEDNNTCSLTPELTKLPIHSPVENGLSKLATTGEPCEAPGPCEAPVLQESAVPCESAVEMSYASWFWSPRTLVATFFSLLFAVLVFHPDIHRLLVRSQKPDEQYLNHVRNFHVWTRRLPQEARDIRLGYPGSLAAALFYPRKTYIIIHGFLGSGTDAWILWLKDALLRREDCNVISVNWSAGSVTAEYYMINPRVAGVGEDVSRLVKFLTEAGDLPLSKVHIIGHSLGAHAAGFAGKSLNGTLSRITGLDPAGHMFHSVDVVDRLHSDDADFVDVIHTHGCTTILNQWNDCFGIDENIGDADFWPNGGERQPACEEGGDGHVSVKDGSSCDHGMAYVLYTESVQYPLSTTHFLARRCTTWDFYNNGWCPCTDTPQYMGFNANPNVRGVFYLNTSITQPFARLDPGCSAAAYTTLQLSGLCLLAVAGLMAALVLVLTMTQVYLGVPVMAAMGLQGRSWLVRSSSTKHIITTLDDTHLVT